MMFLSRRVYPAGNLRRGGGHWSLVVKPCWPLTAWGRPDHGIWDRRRRTCVSTISLEVRHQLVLMS